MRISPHYNDKMHPLHIKVGIFIPKYIHATHERGKSQAQIFKEKEKNPNKLGFFIQTTFVNRVAMPTQNWQEKSLFDFGATNAAATILTLKSKVVEVEEEESSSESFRLGMGFHSSPLKFEISR